MSWEEFNQHPHTICGVIEKWAKERPDKIAFIIYDTEKEVNYKEFKEAITAKKPVEVYRHECRHKNFTGRVVTLRASPRIWPVLLNLSSRRAVTSKPILNSFSTIGISYPPSHNT